MQDAPNEYNVLSSATKHGFDEGEVLNALSKSFVEVSYNKSGNIWAYCGPDKNGNPLELLVDRDKEPPVVFHADRLTVSFEKFIKSQLNRNVR
ncbi:hypothetical protein FACS1894104_4270 [Actinomycetota bacterium]|nr:hypothetical protein FACS1894104_4270 [Actinomycetota bacterium]